MFDKLSTFLAIFHRITTTFTPSIHTFHHRETSSKFPSLVIFWFAYFVFRIS